MSDTIFKCSFWLKSLDENSSYARSNAESVEVLRVSFKNIRKKANEIANEIKGSQNGLTLHDISHLDSLWETAATVAGEQIKLNPIEAYVFGCSILFHDLGMALNLWEQEIENLKSSNEFKDTVFSIYKLFLKRNPTQKELKEVPKDIINQAISARLRDLHAFKASSLPMTSWKFKKQDLYLIEDSDLRQKLGSKIGIIAESHWWSVEEIRTYFEKQRISSAPTSFPAEWTIDNVKLTCLLRLADFIHIDDRRSPNLSYAITNPQGLSDNHWNFQNKLNRAQTSGERLIFSSHTHFKVADNSAWWLAYNTIQEIDRELKSVDNLLIDFQLQRFEAKGVKGIESPGQFSDFITTEGWEPANTQFKISDFHGIIEKFGGEQLYGNKPTVFLRELIQNACDAIQAKRYYNTDINAEIFVKYSKNDEGQVVFEISDNGIGMSRSALLYGLLDFGNSYWKGNLLRKEHPGLLSSGFSPTGKYGIGFFSIFMVANDVKVITKSITDGAQTLVLEFSRGIASNPIIRKADRAEERFESGTTIQILAKESDLLKKMYLEIAELRDVEVENPLAYICRRLAPSLSETLKVTFMDRKAEITITRNDWTEISELALLKRMSGLDSKDKNGWNIERLEYISEFVRPIFSGKDIIARATIVKRIPSNNNYSSCGIVTVGGLNQSRLYRFPGIWIGKNETSSRSSATPVCTFEELQPWLKEQYDLITKSDKITEEEKVDIAGYFLSMGFMCPDLPIAKFHDGWKTYNQISKMDFGDHVLVSPNFKGIEHSNLLTEDILTASYGINIFGIDSSSFNTHQLWEEDIRKIESPFEPDNMDLHIRSPFGFTFLAICKSWDIPHNEVVKESILSISEWKPVVTTAKNKFGEDQKEAVMVVVNPRKTTKKQIYKKYENEIKRWIGNTDDPNFSFDDLKEL